MKHSSFLGIRQGWPGFRATHHLAVPCDFSGGHHIPLSPVDRITVGKRTRSAYLRIYDKTQATGWLQSEMLASSTR